MTQTIKCELKPRLRFPEFRDDWAVKKLGELGKLSGGGTPDKSVTEYWQGDIPWISSSDIYEDDIYTISVTRFINEKSISESATKIVPKGSVLFVSRVGTGKLAVNDKDVCTSQDFTNFLPKKIYNYFLGYFFIANKSALISLGQGTSIKGFSKGDLEKFEVSFPSPLEQQQIADCLSSIDELITAQTQKLNTLKTHKKGLMQQLFPAEGETLPKLRFPEFFDAPEWDIKSLEKICEIKGGKRIPKGFSLTNEKTDYPYVRVSDMYMGGIDTSSVLYVPSEIEKQIRNYKISKNDLFITVAGTIGIVGEVPEELDNANLTENANKIILKSIGKKYLLHYLTGESAQQLISSSVTNNAQPKLALERIRRFPIPVPSKKEQQKIAECLSSIAELITAQTQKLDTLKTHKKALMQQLFPALDEVL